ncbi:MAG: hypothetical protein ABEK00_01410 [Candidatus Nanohaloarchaea archaeon]
MAWHDQSPGSIADLVNEELSPEYALSRNPERIDKNSEYGGQVTLDTEFLQETHAILEYLFDDVQRGGSRVQKSPYSRENQLMITDGEEEYLAKVSAFESSTGDMNRMIEVYDPGMDNFPWTQ